MSDPPSVIFVNDSRKVPVNKGFKHEKLNHPILVPLKKKLKTDDKLGLKSLKDLLMSFNKEMTKKLDGIETRVDCLAENYDNLEKKVERLSSAVSEQGEFIRTTATNHENFQLDDGSSPAIPISSKVTYVKLNKEEDFPNGSWLGDPGNLQCRVRCHIQPTDMYHLHSVCTTAEKMALTLLDFLFDRETQASSNISGTGKHKKKQLDPLLIYGMKCHLKYYFNITEYDWTRIKQNLDSKCRTAFRRKIKGLPLAPKSNLAGNTSNSQLKTKPEELGFDSVSRGSDSLDPHSVRGNYLPFRDTTSESEANILEKALKDAKGGFHIVRQATVEEVAEIQNIQLLYCEEDRLLGQSSTDAQSVMNDSPLHSLVYQEDS
ncbi:hypothetical protein JTE90_007944 [Oedothorax gibbosus]|uniref:Protein BANP n=1 Tax=Oedothorax gibbosus TaxID=931172 RepID=A0AAV6VHR2_9ARAC|nr:hypothetical protein JTE90_007944 [Oedothorax gibbosus]